MCAGVLGGLVQEQSITELVAHILRAEHSQTFFPLNLFCLEMIKFTVSSWCKRSSYSTTKDTTCRISNIQKLNRDMLCILQHDHRIFFVLRHLGV